MTDDGPPQRLKARGDSRFCPDWRATARKKFQDKPENLNTKEYILRTREAAILEDYRQKMNEDHLRRRIGMALEHSTNQMSEEEVLLHRLRIDRCNYLAKTEHLFGRIESPQCRIARVKRRRHGAFQIEM